MMRFRTLWGTNIGVARFWAYWLLGMLVAFSVWVLTS